MAKTAAMWLAVTFVVVVSSASAQLPCSRLDCSLRGTCIGTSLAPICICDLGYSGSRCEILPCNNLLNCMGRGVCLGNALSPICICNPGFSGAHCELSVNTLDPFNMFSALPGSSWLANPFSWGALRSPMKQRDVPTAVKSSTPSIKEIFESTPVSVTVTERTADVSASKHSPESEAPSTPSTGNQN